MEDKETNIKLEQDIRHQEKHDYLVMAGCVLVCLFFATFSVFRIHSYKVRYEERMEAATEGAEAEGTEKTDLKAVSVETQACGVEQIKEATSDPLEETTQIEGSKEREELETQASEVEEYVDLYKCRLVGAETSQKVYSATNSLGEELTEAFYLGTGFFSETVAFYLNGEYDAFYAELSCAENTSDPFALNIYLDDELVRTITVQSIMARTPVELNTEGVTFVKFEILGGLNYHGALLSDGRLHKAGVTSE